MGSITLGVAQDDQVTLGLLRSRDPDGLRRLLENHSGTVRWILQWEFEGIAEMADVAAALDEGALRLLMAPGEIDLDEADLSTWFLLQARACLHRRRNRDSCLEDRGFPRATSLLSAARARGLERPQDPDRTFLDDLWRSLRDLSPQTQEILAADLANGGPVPASKLAPDHGTTPNTIWVLRCKGRKALREAMVGGPRSVGPQ